MANKDNPKKGAMFEVAIAEFLTAQQRLVQKNFVVEISANNLKWPHVFGLGSDSPKVIVECKCHTWTEGGNAPSAKMAVWNEAMYYFSLVPAEFRKLFFVRHSRRGSQGETLLDYYLRRFAHLIPHDVELWEFDLETKTATNRERNSQEK